ncbi:hypothetical protein B5G11_02820, partial [Drancourtella sp. An57]|uniref:DUF7507 domain-containing protein n=1 Tax=Drancourtella sp. An57 TaxID=1965647 RepID=UPI000B5564FF
AGDFEIKTNTEDLKLTAENGGGVYNAAPYYLNNVGATLNGEALKDAKIEYKVGDGEWTTTAPSATNVSDSKEKISVRVTLEGYETQQINDLKITVTHKDVTVTANRAEKLFGKEDPKFSATVTGTLNNDEIKYTVTRPGAGTDEAVKLYKDALVAAGDEIQGNYKVTYVAGDFEIKTNTEDLKFVEADTKGYNGVYDGKAHDGVTSVKVTGVGEAEIAAEDMTVKYRLSDEDEWSSEMPKVTDVADTTPVQIQVTVANYEPITTTVQATVTERPVSITTESATRTYNGTALTAPGKLDGIVEGESYGFTVTGSQTLVGESQNTYTLTWAEEGNGYTAKKDNYTVTETLGTLTVTDDSETDPINPEDVVKKTHGAPEDGIYEAGEVVTFTVTVTNIYDQTKTITLNEIDGVTLEQAVFEGVEPGETVSTTATYTITEADVIAGEFVNTVTASFSDEESTFEDEDIVDEIEESEGHLTINKETTSTPANGSSYVLGETITYKITATNDGNLTLKDVKVVDELTNGEWTIETLAPGASESFDTAYTVTEADILAGTVVNTATAEGTSPDPEEPEVPVEPGEETDPTETPKPSLFVDKEAQPDEDGVYNLGDEITYTIKVTNNGNVTVTDITVTDELTGGNWTIESLAPGESREYETVYTVTEDDILNGSITNIAVVEGTDPNEDPVDTEGEETVPTDPADSHLTVTKRTTSEPGEDGTYDLGDTITYEIVATNDGNLTLNNVVVTDDLTGDRWEIETLAPGQSRTFEAEYVVTEEDIHNGSVVNEATATADGKEEEDPEIIPGETEDPTNPESPSLDVDKALVDGKDEYEIGDVIEYAITVTNNGNVTQNDIRVTDMLNAAGNIVITDVSGAEGEIDGASVTLDSLAPGETATIHCEYTVLKADRGNTITNAAIADDEGKGDGEDPTTPEVPAEVADVYDINVIHQFADGEEGDVELPDDYTIENLPVGTEREITAENVEGYTVSPASQTVTVEESDVTVTFVYYTDEVGTDPENPDNPDNVPDRYQAVVTFEAVNGTVDRSTAVVTLMRDGEPAEDGTGYLTEDQIATATANAGYDQNSLTWSSETPTTEVPITGDRTFTATFAATQTPVIPEEPEEPTTPTVPTLPTTPTTPGTPTTPTLPVTPANPGTPAAAGTTAPIVYADGVVVDDAEPAEDDYNLNEVERDGDTETIDEDATPLGNMDLDKDDDHKCCILHFILLLLALIVELIYTHDRKKRQERIFELRRELEDIDDEELQADR